MKYAFIYKNAVFSQRFCLSLCKYFIIKRLKWKLCMFYFGD
jgi:hypothetical protein